MKVTKHDVDEEHLAAVYTVDEIDEDDIPEPSPELIKLVKESPELSYINPRTMGRFRKKLKKRFAKR